MRSLTVGELAERAGIHPESVRFYETQRLMPEPVRTRAGYRMYTEVSVRRIRFIKRAQELGFSLKEVKELLAFSEDRGLDCSDVRALAQAKVVEISSKIETLESMRRALGELTEACPGSGSVTRCSILECISPQPGGPDEGAP